MRIGIVGGTGKEGRGLAPRWARAGHAIALGSRDPERARAAAAELAVHGKVVGGTNEQAVQDADVVVLAVPYGAHAETLRGLAAGLEGRVLIDITVPLKPPKVSEVHLPEGQAAALEAQAIVGPKTPVVAGLHHVSSTHLGDPAHAIDCDVLYCTDDARARAVMASLLGDLGVRGIDAGPLRNAVALESLTPVLIHINKTYKRAGTGIRFTGLP